MALSDGDFAITGGGSSIGAVILPDSSQVILAADTRVQLSFFNQTRIANARFLLFNGKVRFEIHHPQGAMANYTFSTSTGQIAVRGTSGDIEYGNNQSMRVNVYELTDPNLPVSVVLRDGRAFTLRVGESLFAHFVNGKLEVDLNKVTDQELAASASNFNSPPGKKGNGGGGGAAGGPAPKPTPSPPPKSGNNAFVAELAVELGAVLLIASFWVRPAYHKVTRTLHLMGRFPMSAYCRERLADRPNIDLHYIGRVLENPARTRVQRDGRIRRWAFISETQRWLRVTTLENGVVINAIFDRRFQLEDRVRPRK